MNDGGLSCVRLGFESWVSLFVNGTTRRFRNHCEMNWENLLTHSTKNIKELNKL